MNFDRRLLLIASAALLIGGGALLLPTLSTKSVDWPKAKPEPLKPILTFSRTGIEPREFDPANAMAHTGPAGGWHLGDTKHLLALANNAMHTTDMVHDERWRPTNSWLGAPGFEYIDARHRCGLRHLAGRKEQCVIDWDIVMERSGDLEGEVKYVRIKPDQELDQGCRDYGHCMARDGWLGLRGPLPSTDNDNHAVEMGEIYTPFDGTKEDYIAYLEREITRAQSEIELLASVDDPSVAQAIDMHRQHIEYIRNMMEALDAQDGS